nr:MAG: glycoprotein [Drosophila Burdiehouse burn chuvirus]
MSRLLQVISGLLIITVICNTSVKSFIVFDCLSPGINITEIDRTTAANCRKTDVNITEETVNIQLIQLADKIPVTVTICKVFVSRIIEHCGILSYRKSVTNGFAEYIVDLTESSCLEAYKDGVLILPNGHKLMNLVKDTTTSIPVLLAGSVSSSGSCSGSEYNDQFGSWESVIVQSTVRVTLKRIKVQSDTDNDKIMLENGLVCKYTDGKCLDIENGEAYWSVQQESICAKHKHVSLYTGIATKITDKPSMMDNSREIITYIVEGEEKVFALRITKPYYGCMIPAYHTEHPRLVIYEVSDPNRLFPTSEVDTKSLDLLTYVNTKFVYFDRKLHLNLRKLYDNIETDRCDLDKRTLDMMISIASFDPDEFAFQYMQGPGHMATVMGEIIYISKCPMTEAVFRKTEECYLELPIISNNRSVFMKPRSHIVVDKGNQIDCGSILRPKFKIHNQWFSVGKDIMQAHSPFQLEPRMPREFQYSAPKSLALNGIYSNSEVSAMISQLMYPVQRQAISTILTRSLTGQNTNMQGASLRGLIDGPSIDAIKEGIAEKTWGQFMQFGNIVSACLGIIIAAKIMLWIFRTFVNGFLLWDIFGLSVRLIASISDTLTNLMVHRKVRTIIPTYSKKPHNTVIRIKDNDAESESDNEHEELQTEKAEII